MNMGFGALQKPVYTTTWDAAVDGNITTAAWQQILASVPKGASALEIFNPSASPMQISQGAPGSETGAYLFPWTVLPGGSGIAAVEVMAGKPLTVKAMDANIVAGRLVFNFYA